MKNAWRRSRIVFSSSPLERHPKLKEPVVVPNVHSRSSSIQRQPLPDSLLFVGNLNHPPNIEGIAFFVSKVLPLLAPQITITIVGRRPLQSRLRAQLDRLGRSGRVEIHYDVESCASFYDRSMASIVPIRSGGGTRVKILESFAAMCPVISTSKGCEGLDVSHEQELLIADSPAAFAAACTRLLTDKSLNDDLAKAAHRFFVERHSQRIVDEVLKTALGKVLATGAR